MATVVAAAFLEIEFTKLPGRSRKNGNRFLFPFFCGILRMFRQWKEAYTGMAKTMGIGIQNFEKVITNHCFYVDKSYFIREWWENQDDVTLITRSRRFG